MNNLKKKKPITTFNANSIIRKKRDGDPLSEDEIDWFIDNVSKNKIPDYQTSALLMAIYLNGLNVKETAALTNSMLYSGQVLDFKDSTTIDKHSTGGVGDKTSFIIAPIAAACGVKVPMIAGRGLGHTGGTVDKIESIEGFNVSLPLAKFTKQVKKNCIALIGQTAKIAPADKIIYALRDVTSTVESIPLITASIMSKKLAEGTSGIVMDIKFGNGAFMKTFKDAKLLAQSIEKTALRFNKNIMTLITDMSQPLGKNIGNSLEVIESIDTLRGTGPADLTEISLQLAGGMIYLAGLSKSHKEGIKKAEAVIKNGKALIKFKELIKMQGGDPSYVDDLSKFKVAKIKTDVLAQKSGFLHSVDTTQIGLLCTELGGGRKVASDKIDHSVGFVIHKKIGDKINKGDCLLTVYHHTKQKEKVRVIVASMTDHILHITKSRPLKKPLIKHTVMKWSKK